jgi:hypothetical protein
MPMNWKDPVDGVVHIVDYPATSASYIVVRQMYCGHVVDLTRDGFLDQRVGSLHVALPFVHTRDPATCLTCLATEKHIPS